MISQPTLFYIHTDLVGNGPAYGRNECIKNLYDAGCDYIFLFDDDTYPSIKGWEDRMINWMTVHDVDLVGMVDIKNEHFDYTSGDTLSCKCGLAGPFVAMTRKTVETIGYYNTNFDTYGWEDVTYYQRAIKAGLCGENCAIVPTWLCTYIHDEDVYNEDPIENISREDKQRYIDLNAAEAQRESTGKIYYSYEETKNSK